MMTRAAERNPGEPPVQTVHIRRRPGARQVTAYCFHDFAQLARDAQVDDLGRQCIFADLSCGPWRGHWLARELCGQLDLCEPPPILPILHDDYPGIDAYADTVSQLVDAESSGNRNFAMAYEFACRIAARIREYAISHVFVVAPKDDHLWGVENLHLLKLLSDAAPQEGFQLWCIARSDEEVSPVAGIEWVPFNAPAARALSQAGCGFAGLVLEQWLAAANLTLPCLRVRDGRLLISPNASAGTMQAAQLQRLATLALPNYLRAYLALRAPIQNVPLLQAFAGQCFAEGGYDAALKILDGIDTRALDARQCAAVEAQKQRILIALMRFERTAQGMLPSDSMPDDVKASLYQSKAWGLVMTGRARDANDYFDLARKHFNRDASPRLALYLLNISALAKLKSGDVDGALLLEKEIEASLRDPRRRDWHLLYINALNLARIHKKVGDLHQSAQYYRLAFHVTSGARTDSDLLYMNLCHAQIETLRGNTAEALGHWLRAAVHWLSNPLPEALAPRVAQAVLGKPLNDSEADVEEISNVLDKALCTAAAEYGLAFVQAGKAVAFARLTRPGQADTCVASDALTVALSSQAVAPCPYAGPRYDALKRTITGMLAALFPTMDMSGVSSILSDARHGIELPMTAREACWSCWRYDIQDLLYAGRHYALGGAEDDALATFVVRPGAALGAIVRVGERLRIHFKRYLPPIELDGRERAIVECLDKPLTLAQLAERLGCTIRTCAMSVRLLEDRHVVGVG